MTEEDLKDEDNICSICLHEIDEGRRIHCGHVFHLGCLRTWIQGNPNLFCPKCKKQLDFQKVYEPNKRVLREDSFNKRLKLKIEEITTLWIKYAKTEHRFVHSGIAQNVQDFVVESFSLKSSELWEAEKKEKKLGELDSHHQAVLDFITISDSLLPIRPKECNKLPMESLSSARLLGG